MKMRPHGASLASFVDDENSWISAVMMHFLASPISHLLPAHLWQYKYHLQLLLPVVMLGSLPSLLASYSYCSF